MNDTVLQCSTVFFIYCGNKYKNKRRDDAYLRLF